MNMKRHIRNAGSAVIALLLLGGLPGGPVMRVHAERLSAYERREIEEKNRQAMEERQKRLQALTQHAQNLLKLAEIVCAMKDQGLVKAGSSVPPYDWGTDEIAYIIERCHNAGIDLPGSLLGFVGGALVISGPGAPITLPAILAGAAGAVLVNYLSHDGSVDMKHSMAYLLFQSDRPSETGVENPFVEHTLVSNVRSDEVKDATGNQLPVSRELLLALRVTKSGQPASPADVMRMALEICGGDYPTAMLTAHNFLKEVAWGSRNGRPAVIASARPPAGGAASQELWESYRKLAQDNGLQLTKNEKGNYELSLPPGKILDKLQELRPQTDRTQDKPGPWYHTFGVLYMSSVANGGRYTAEAYAQGESLMRHYLRFLFSSSPDQYKELISILAAREGGRILDCLKDLQDTAGTGTGTGTQNPPPGGMPTATTETNNWYCTNRPVVDQTISAPPQTLSGPALPAPNTKDYEKLEKDLLGRLDPKKAQLLKGVSDLMNKKSPNQDSAKAYWMRLLSSCDADRIRSGLIERGQAIDDPVVRDAIIKLKQAW